MDENEKKNSFVRDLSKIQDIGDVETLPTLHEDEISKKVERKLRKSKSLKLFPERTSKRSYEIFVPNRPPSPHPASPQNTSKPRNMVSVATNFSLLQRQANNTVQEQQNITHRGSSPRLLGRSRSANILFQRLQTPFSKSSISQPRNTLVDDNHSKHGETSFPKVESSSNNFTSGLSKDGNIRPGFCVSSNDTPVGLNKTCLLQNPSSSENNSAPVRRTPTPAIPRILPSKQDINQTNHAHTYTITPRRLRPLSPIKMPLDAVLDLVDGRPNMTTSAIDSLSNKTNEVYFPEEEITDEKG